MCLHMHLDHYMYPIVILTTFFFWGGGGGNSIFFFHGFQDVARLLFAACKLLSQWQLQKACAVHEIGTGSTEMH